MYCFALQVILAASTNKIHGVVVFECYHKLIQRPGLLHRLLCLPSLPTSFLNDKRGAKLPIWRR